MKILIVEDHPLYSEGLALLILEIIPDAKVERAGHAITALQWLESDEAFDLVLLDLRMPGFDGASALLALRSRHPGVPVIVVSADEELDTIRGCIDAGASGYVPKSARKEILAAALAVVADGGIYLPPALRAVPPPTHRAHGESLTAREIEILRAVCLGEANKTIARRLGISDATVRAHLGSVFRALRVQNRTQAALVARQRGLVDSDKDSR